MSWRNIIKRELYPLASRKELARSPMVGQQMEDALNQVQIDENYDACCENARARVIEIVGSKGQLESSTGESKSGKEAVDHISEYDCNKLRQFVEHNAFVAKTRSSKSAAEFKEILDDWKDCEGE